MHRGPRPKQQRPTSDDERTASALWMMGSKTEHIYTDSNQLGLASFHLSTPPSNGDYDTTVYKKFVSHTQGEIHTYRQTLSSGFRIIPRTRVICGLVTFTCLRGVYESISFSSPEKGKVIGRFKINIIWRHIHRLFLLGRRGFRELPPAGPCCVVLALLCHWHERGRWRERENDSLLFSPADVHRTLFVRCAVKQWSWPWLFSSGNSECGTVEEEEDGRVAFAFAFR